MMMMEIWLTKGAFALYAAATALAFTYLFSKDEKWSLWMLRLLGVGVALHLGSFAVRQQLFWAIPENRWFLPVNSFFGALSYMSLALTAAFFVIEARKKLSQNRTDVDFGYRGTASLGDRVWNDADGDGVQDAGEAGLTGVTVELLNGDGTVIATTTTGADGIYTFSNLLAGSYTVRVVSSTLPAGSAPTFDLDGTATAHTAAVTVTGGQTRTVTFQTLID